MWTQLGETGNYTPKIPKLDSEYFQRSPSSVHPACFANGQDKGEAACSIQNQDKLLEDYNDHSTKDSVRASKQSINQNA